MRLILMGARLWLARHLYYAGDAEYILIGMLIGLVVVGAAFWLGRAV
jgi:hypothetical protein